MSSTNMTKYILAFIGAVIVAGTIYGAYLYPTSQISFGSPAGTTFNSAKIAAVDITPLTAGATSTSILNTDASARYVASFGFAGCTGQGTSFTYPNTNATGLAAELIQVATTSVPNNGLQGNTNYALNMTVPTSSAVYVQNSSSTPPSNAGYWASGTYLTFTTNATNTGACIFEVDYVAS